MSDADRGTPEIRRIPPPRPSEFSGLLSPEKLEAYNVGLVKDATEAVNIDWKGATVLDVACGAKQHVVDHLWPTAALKVGLDLRMDSLLRNEHVSPVRANMYAMPVGSQTIDVVISVDTIEHSTTPRDFLGEIYRVLKPGGRAVLVTPNLPGYQALIAKTIGNTGANLVWKLWKGKSIPFDVFYRCNSVRAISRTAREVGLELTKVIYVPMVPHFFSDSRLLITGALAFNYATERMGMPWLWITMIAELRRPL